MQTFSIFKSTLSSCIWNIVTICCYCWASVKMWKKIKDYAEMFGLIMRKQSLIMRKLHRLMHLMSPLNTIKLIK